MKVFFLIIFAILLLISILYLAFTVRIKINITIDEAVLLAKIKIFRFNKSIVLRFNYFDMIKKYFNKEKNKKKKRHLDINPSYLIKPFFIKNIDIYSECFEEKFSVAVEFSVVSVISRNIH